MSVKRAITLCSNEVALDILRGPLPPEETAATFTYIKQCYKLFTIFNNKLEVNPKCYKELLKIMLWFDEWNKETKQESSRATNGLKIHWKKFITRITFDDQKSSVRAFLGVVQYVQMHHPELHLIPKTMCQDDVKNYFSLQRAGYPEENQQRYSCLSHQLLWKLNFFYLLKWQIHKEHAVLMIWQPFLIWFLFSWLNQNKQPLTISTILVKKRDGNYAMMTR